MSTPSADSMASDFEVLFKSVYQTLYGEERPASLDVSGHYHEALNGRIDRAADIASRLLQEALRSDALRYGGA